MINIYMNKEKIPETKILIYDPEEAFLNVEMNGNEFQRTVLKEIEKGEYIDSMRFKDRFGNMLYYTDMSTSSKILLEAESLNGCVINATEIGLNATKYIWLLKDASLYFNGRSSSFLADVDAIEVLVDGTSNYTSLQQLNSYIEGGDFSAI